MHLYATLAKIEDQPDGTIKVYGVASTGARDEAGEIVAPEAMRAALPDYMRFGALREMHQAAAAGTTLEAEVDADGCTHMVAHVVDPVAVSKVKAGVYKGLSIGGKVLQRDPKDPTVITAIKLVETSLVDRPCNPEAVITLWKIDGAAAPPLEKIGRRNSAKDLATLQDIHDQLVRLGAACDPDNCGLARAGSDDDDGYGEDQDGVGYGGPDPDLDDDDEAQAAKVAGYAAEPWLAKALAEALPQMAELGRRVDRQAEEIERLKAQPLPARTAGSSHARPTSVEKGLDAGGEAHPGSGAASLEAVERALDALPAEAQAHLLMKAALARPIPVRL